MGLVNGFVYVVFPLIAVLGLIRKFRVYQWGHCKSKSSLHGKLFIVTGANSGIGKETVRVLARRKARIVMACRDLQTAKTAIEEIRRDVSTGELIPMCLDLASLESVRRFASEVLKDFPKINVLINNAGVSVPVSLGRKTEDGFEINFGINHLGHFLLTNLLLPRIKESAPSRIVIVSSMLHERGQIQFDNLNGEKGFANTSQRMNPGYCNSKLANMYFCKELAKRTEGSGVDCYALCPGFIFGFEMVSVHSVFANCICFHADSITEESLEGKSGFFYRNCDIYESKVKFYPNISTKLWEVSEEMVGLKKSEEEKS
ncbi:Retinol dehydrogenase 12 [Blattella germanica]|nr:Retinol dehydrogenase 12 [Blattella germanica]